MAKDLTPEGVIDTLWIVWFLTWWAAAIWSDRSVKRPGTNQFFYRALAAFGACLLFGMYRVQGAGEPILWHSLPVVSWPMVAIVLLGLGFTWWARLHLGRLWSSNVARKAEHHVVDTGPYGIVRHPIYTGIIIASVATAVTRGTLAAWIGVGLMTYGWYIKARMEEGFLREQLGVDEYGSYARRVPMLIPFL
jgi:protein-S-isoprenylcysteine O-methyltransferase Ste14